MIGRSKELGAILGQIEAMCAQKHTQNVVFVTGEAGIGKTTVLFAVREELAKKKGPGAPLAVATECSTPLLGQDVGQVEALEPWAELLEKIIEHDGAPGKKNEMAKLMGSVALTWVHVVPVVGGIIESSFETAALFKEHMGHDDEKNRAASQEQMFQQYVTFLGKASEAHPLVLLLDDFHWADTSSTNLLFSAARHLAKKRVLFIVAYRADDAASSRDGKGHPILHVRNELGRYSLYMDVVVPKLPPKDLDALLRERYSRYERSEEFERWLADRSGGNALFITQYLATLEEDGIVDPQTGEFRARFESVRVPTSAFSVVEERIRRLDDESRELLRYASVEGATFTAAVLSAITDTPRLKLLQKVRLIAEKHGVVKSLGKQRIYASESTAFQFTNVLMQRALYESLEEEERDELHARIFRSIQEDFAQAEETDSSIVGLAVRLAAHAATTDDRMFAAKLLLDAAKVSWERFAEDETLSVIRSLMEDLEALDLKSMTDPSLRSGVRLNSTRVVRGKPDEREVRLLEAEAHLLSGLVHKFRGRYPQALERLRAARALFEKLGDERRALDVMMREAFTLENAKDYPAAETLSRVTLARAETLGDDNVRGGMLNNLGLVMTGLGRAAEGIDYQRQSLSVREQAGYLRGQAVSLGSMGLALRAEGRFDEALAYHRRALELRQKLGDRVGQGYSFTNIGVSLAAIGRLDEALEHYRKSVEVREASGDVLGLVVSLDNEAKLLLELGRAPEAIECLERALRLRETLGNRSAEATALLHLGKLHREAEAHARSRDVLERASSLAASLGTGSLAEEVAAELEKLPPPPPKPVPAETKLETNGAAIVHPPSEPAPAAPMPPIARAVAWLDAKLELRPTSPSRKVP